MTMLAPQQPSTMARRQYLTPIQRQRLTPIQREVFSLILDRGQISYNDIAAELYIDRRTAIIAVRQLENEHLIMKTAGQGGKANQYTVCEVQR